MYLSKILVSLKKARNPYTIHRELWRLFPNRPDDRRAFLFRVEKQLQGTGSLILMQSAHEPIETHQTSRIIASRAYDFSIQNGQRLRFRLRANPIKTIYDERGRLNRKGETKKCRVPLIREEDQKSWLERKFEPICSLEALIINREVPLYFRKSKEQRTGKIQTILFDGILKVNDDNTFVAALAKGIGPAKAFGCGLLSIAKV